MRTVRHVGAVAGAILLAGCTGMPTYQLNQAEPSGDEFTQRLAMEYRDFANFESVQMYDWDDADLFAEKGLRAAQGEAVPPEALEDWDLPQGAVAELSDARARLVSALEGGARQSNPTQAAIAQARFDCWVEQAEENAQPQHIQACRDEFFAALQTLEGVTVTPTAEAPGAYFVFFDFDEAEVTDAGDAIIDQVVNDFRASGAGGIAVIGHTDTSGSDDYNRRLGERRAAAIREALVAAGIPANQVTTSTQGETALLVETPDGVREPSNRRGEIRFQ